MQKRKGTQLSLNILDIHKNLTSLERQKSLATNITYSQIILSLKLTICLFITRSLFQTQHVVLGHHTEVQIVDPKVPHTHRIKKTCQQPIHQQNVARQSHIAISSLDKGIVLAHHALPAHQHISADCNTSSFVTTTYIMAQHQ